MCSEVLSRYLADETGMSLEVLQKLIDYDPDLPDSEFNQLMTPQQTKSLKQAIASIKVLDPAVGSGAFPLGMMQVILNVRQAVARREGMKVSRGSLTISQWKRDIIANNLYGVDIKPEAIEIAKLRMWLSLVVDIPNIEDVEPLPNLDYKLMCGDSLISTIHGEQLIPDPTKTQQGMLAVTPIQIAIAPLLELEKRYFDVQTEERHRLREQILEAEANVFRVAVSDRQQYWLGKQKELETEIKTMKGKVSRTQEKERKEIADKLTNLAKFASEVESGERSLNFFQYHLHFRDVFESKGGFDVVIGNPPYVGEKGNKDVFREVKNGHLGVFYQKKMDLFYFFFHLALNLGSERVNIAFITTNYFITATSGKTLRQDIKNRAILRKIINFNELKIFESALGQHNMITVFQKGTDAKAICDTTIIKRKGFATTEILSRIFEQSDTETNYYKIPQISLYDGDEVYIRLNNNQNKNGASIQTIIDKIQSDSLLLGDICNVNQGLRTGADKVSQKHIESHSINNVNKGDGIFIISERELLRLNLNETELLKIKPLFKNSDINRYFCSKKSQYYLIDIFYPNDRNINTNQIPNIIKHLQKFKPILESRKENANGIDKAILMGKWWFASVRRKLDFDSEKIVSPQRAKRNIFGYNSIPWYASADVYFITQKNATYSLKYVLSLLNSKLYFLWLFHRGKRKGNILELYQKPLSEIPIKQLTSKEQELLINLVDKILTITGKDDYLKDKKKQAEVSNLEAEIDKLIYQLYNLTEEEIAIVEKSL
jgi:adenine-specific DNA-methyltransferase